MSITTVMSFSNVTIPVEHLDAAYEAVCALDARDDLKAGGTDEAPAFVGLPANFPEVYSDARQIFEGLGYGVEVTSKGDLHLASFEGDQDQDFLFLNAVAPYVVSKDDMDPQMLFCARLDAEHDYLGRMANEDICDYLFTDGKVICSGSEIFETKHLSDCFAGDYTSDEEMAALGQA